MGGLWGAGHNAGQIIFAILFLVLRERLPFNLEAIESGGKALVGATLFLIGMLVRPRRPSLRDAHPTAAVYAHLHDCCRGATFEAELARR